MNKQEKEEFESEVYAQVNKACEDTNFMLGGNIKFSYIEEDNSRYYATLIAIFTVIAVISTLSLLYFNLADLWVSLALGALCGFIALELEHKLKWGCWWETPWDWIGHETYAIAGMVGNSIMAAYLYLKKEQK